MATKKQSAPKADVVPEPEMLTGSRPRVAEVSTAGLLDEGEKAERKPFDGFVAIAWDEDGKCYEVGISTVAAKDAVLDLKENSSSRLLLLTLRVFRVFPAGSGS